MHKFDGELMYKEGHIGLTFLLMSIIMLPFPYSHNKVIMIVMASALSALPDIDLEWQRKGYSITIEVLLIVFSSLLYVVYLLEVYFGWQIRSFYGQVWGLYPSSWLLLVI
jgi:hypothetical protein